MLNLSWKSHIDYLSVKLIRAIYDKNSIVVRAIAPKENPWVVAGGTIRVLYFVHFVICLMDL